MVPALLRSGASKKQLRKETIRTAKQEKTLWRNGVGLRDGTLLFVYQGNWTREGGLWSGSFLEIL